MNFMKFKKDHDSLQAELTGDFNLNVVRQIQPMISDRDQLFINLGNARFVNSEAVIFLHGLLRAGKNVRLKDPPKNFFEVLQILGLHEVWDLKNIVEP